MYYCCDVLYVTFNVKNVPLQQAKFNRIQAFTQANNNLENLSIAKFTLDGPRATINLKKLSYIDAGDEICWWQLWYVDDFGRIRHQHSLSFNIGVEHQYPKDVTNIEICQSSISTCQWHLFSGVTNIYLARNCSKNNPFGNFERLNWSFSWVIYYLKSNVVISDRDFNP